MSSRNRPKFNTESRLTPNDGGPAGERPGSAPERKETEPPAASRPALREFFAPGTVVSAAAATGGSGGLPPAAALLDRPGRAAGGEVAAASPGAAGEPGAQPVRRVGRRVDVLGDVAHANPCTPPPGGSFSVWR